LHAETQETAERDKADALAVPEAANITWSMDIGGITPAQKPKMAA
jgi:hypothetical protein